MSPRTDEFYVGYLPVPAGQRTFIAWVVSAAALVILGLAAAAAWVQSDPGNGQWEYGRVDEFEGTLSMRPYPMLRESDGRTWLLVGQGKVGVGKEYSASDGVRVRLRATRVERGALRMLELEGETVKATGRGENVPSSMAGEAVALRGEIVDPKCFGGAMKPGAGKAHKGCATLCLRGGIPPVFVTEGGAVHVVVDAEGKGLTGATLEQVLPYAGDRIEVRARVERIGEMTVVRLDATSLRRL